MIILVGDLEDSNLLCETMVFDKETGKCSNGKKSKNKGKKCDADEECLLEGKDIVIEGLCKCGWNNLGHKYCDILDGDDAWVTSRQKVIQIYNH